jgi:hypothetical protein
MRQLLLTVLVLSNCICLAVPTCDDLQNSAPDQLVSYLHGITPNAENATCITSAIRRLGEQHYEPAAGVLAKLLDFRRPLDDREKQGLYLHLQTVGETYPAAAALVQIGQHALPSILEVIKSDSRLTTGREHAVWVWMGVYRDEPARGVALLKREADATSDSVSKERVLQAISKAVKMCGPSFTTKCKEAAKTGYWE